MSGIMLTLLGSTFGGAKNFIATFNDENTGYNTKSVAVCTNSNDNIYVSAQNFYNSGNSVTYQANFKVSNAGELKATVGSRSTSGQLLHGMSNHIKSNGNYVYAFYNNSDNLRIHELTGDFSTTVVRKGGSTNGSSDNFDGVRSCVWRSSNDQFYITRWTGAQSQVMYFSAGTTNNASPQNYTIQQGRTHTFVNYSGSAQGDPMFQAGGIAIDSSGNIYTGGSFPFFGYEATFHKYNSSCQHQWTRSVRDGSHSCRTRAVAVDSNDNPYFCGGLEGNDDTAFVTKYNSSGTQQWISLRKDRDYGGFIFSSIHIDSNDNIYVAGSMSEDGYPGGGFSATQKNIGVVFKYNTSGTLQWERGISYSSTTNGFSNQSPGNMPTALTTDSEGNVIFVFAQHSSSSGQNKTSIRLAKLPADGSMMGTYSDGGVDGSVKYAETDTAASTVNPDYRTINRSVDNSVNNYFINQTGEAVNSISYPTDIAEIS